MSSKTRFDPKIRQFHVISLVDSEINSELTSPRSQQWEDYKYCKIFPAFDSRNGWEKLLDENSFKLDMAKPYSNYLQHHPGGVGCFLSHYKLWEKIAKYRGHATLDYFCILEDDAVSANVDNLKNNEGEFFLDLEDLTDIIAIHRRGSTGTEAYLINKEGAKLLLDLCDRTMTCPVDRFMWEHVEVLHPERFSRKPKIYIESNFVTTIRNWSQRDMDVVLSRIQRREDVKDKVLLYLQEHGDSSVQSLINDNVLKPDEIHHLNEYIGRNPNKVEFYLYERTKHDFYSDIDDGFLTLSSNQIPQGFSRIIFIESAKLDLNAELLTKN